MPEQYFFAVQIDWIIPHVIQDDHSWLGFLRSKAAKQQRAAFAHIVSVDR